MTGRRSLRTRIAVVGGLGVFVLGAILLIVVGQLVQQRIADNPDEAGAQIISELGFDVDGLDELIVTDPSGTAIPADEINPILLDIVDTTRADIARRILLILPALALVAAGAGWWLSGRATRPLLAMTATARQVSSERLDARIHYEGPEDELRDLAHEFDVMMERLEHAFAAQRHFAAAASHELRTPLTVIRTELDVALDTPDPSREEIDEMANEIRNAINRSEKVIDGLLMLARSGIVDLVGTADLSTVVGSVLDDAADQITDRAITLRKEHEGDAWIACDPILIERMVRNLVDNAVIHNQEGGRIDIGVRRSLDQVFLQISNTGQVLDESSAARLGEPFYRAGQRNVPGTGLGVAIARSIAEAHGGHLDIDLRQGGGVNAIVTLPALEDAHKAG